ncbi:hypothetical protein U2453_30735, partial [Klebsiella pneumoniae]
MSTLTRRPLHAAGLVVAVLLGLAPAMQASAQAAPSYDTLLERLDQLPGTRVGTALAEAADARATLAPDLQRLGQGEHGVGLAHAAIGAGAPG